MKNINQLITDRIIEKLQEGKVPWRKPWKTQYSGSDNLPKNAITKRPYNGINRLLLWIESYDSPYWLTYRQANNLGGYVNLGEKSTTVIFYQKREKTVINPETNEKEVKSYWITKDYRVFNIEQCTFPDEILAKWEIEIPEEPDNNLQPIEKCEILADTYLNRENITVQHKQNIAFYRAKSDMINLPKLENFENSEEYHSTEFHEMIHSTGTPERLDRKEFNKYHMARTERSKEELTAEIGACFLCAQTGIDCETFGNSVNYISSWIEVLKNNNSWITCASSKAQKAVDFINS